MTKKLEYVINVDVSRVSCCKPEQVIWPPWKLNIKNNSLRRELKRKWAYYDGGSLLTGESRFAVRGWVNNANKLRQREGGELGKGTDNYLNSFVSASSSPPLCSKQERVNSKKKEKEERGKEERVLFTIINSNKGQQARASAWWSRPADRPLIEWCR